VIQEMLHVDLDEVTAFTGVALELVSKEYKNELADILN
jgi:hypothetical protein